MAKAGTSVNLARKQVANKQCQTDPDPTLLRSYQLIESYATMPRDNNSCFQVAVQKSYKLKKSVQDSNTVYCNFTSNTEIDEMTQMQD